MLIHSITFWLLSVTVILSALMVVSSRNPVHSVLFLILTFFVSAGILILLGAEFLAMLLIVVYVGAIAVLFLFVVMMMDIRISHLKQGFLGYLPIGILISLILLGELTLVGMNWVVSDQLHLQSKLSIEPMRSNIQSIGDVLYTEYVYFFELASLILLVAMIGAIILTLRHRKGVKRQNIARQIGRKTEDSVELVDIEPGRGI